MLIFYQFSSLFFLYESRKTTSEIIDLIALTFICRTYGHCPSNVNLYGARPQGAVSTWGLELKIGRFIFFW